MLGLLAANATDAIGTLHAVGHGAAELNPVMRELIAISPFLFLAFKAVVISALIVFVSRHAPAWALTLVALPYLTIAGAQCLFA